MKTAEYKLPAGVHPMLEPVETGKSPDTKTKDGKVIPGRPVYAYKTVTTREAETLDEFQTGMVEQDKPAEHTLSLAQAQFDIIVQRKIREFFQSEEAAQMLDGKHADTKDLTEDERVEYVLQAGQEIGDAYRYGARTPGAGTGGNAAAKQALAKENKIKAAAAQSPELAAKLAELEATLKALGIES